MNTRAKASPPLHTHFDDLSPALRRAIESNTGSVRASHSAGAGLNSLIAAILETDSGSVFLKGVPDNHHWAPYQDREATVNPHVAAVSPRLLWHETLEGWNLLAFEVVEQARHADYTPGPGFAREDLPMLAECMKSLGALPCPDLPEILSAEQRWAGYVEHPGDERHFAGDTLLHTDYNPANVLITPDRAWIVDWAWPTRGAAFIDPALLILRLIDAGHDPAAAEDWAAQLPAWKAADPAAINLFAAANARVWRQIANDEQGSWKQRMAEAADDWNRLRAS